MLRQAVLAGFRRGCPTQAVYHYDGIYNTVFGGACLMRKIISSKNLKRIVLAVMIVSNLHFSQQPPNQKMDKIERIFVNHQG